jgi:hypothetical protein
LPDYQDSRVVTLTLLLLAMWNVEMKMHPTKSSIAWTEQAIVKLMLI